MNRSIAGCLTAALVGGAVVLVGPGTAGAGVGVGTSGGNQINLLITGNAGITFTCSGGKAAIVSSGTTIVPTPNLACSAITKVVAAADSANQSIDARGLDDAAFSSHPFINASLGDGADSLADTARADTITMGAGFDHFLPNPKSVTDTSVNLGGAELDTVEALTPSTGGTISGSTPGDGDLQLTETNSSGTHTDTIVSAEFLWLEGGAGNDTLTATGLTTGSAVDQLRFDAGGGNDTMSSGQVGASLMFGNAGSNTFNTGSAASNIITDSDTDTIHAGGPANILDSVSLRSGGRTVSASASTQGWQLQLPHGDAVAKVRTGTGGGTVLTATLDRFGQQALPPTVTQLSLSLYPTSGTTPDDHGLFDVVAQSGKTITIAGVPSGGGTGTIADVLIPSGSWSTSGSVGTSSTLTITPTGGYGVVKAQQLSAVSVHNPWPSLNESFAHRSVRDLMFRIPTTSERTLVAGQLNAHTKTRAQITAALMGTDEYRGLDVNRTFLDFLKRAADPSGQAYWVNSLSHGKSLRQFRAQLFGSNEYFTKAGGTNLSFLLSAYADVFGRAPDAGGQAYWLNKLNSGTERGIVARAFLASTEARRTIVREQYLRLLTRFPTTEEADSWIPQLDSPMGEQNLIATLVNGTEYFNE